MNKSNMLVPQTLNQRLERKIYQEAVAIVKETRFFASIVQQMNEGLEDARLDSASGVLEIIQELKSYAGLLGETTIPIINGDKDRKGNMLVFFEV